MWFRPFLLETLNEYGAVLVFIGLGLGIACFMMTLSWIRGVHRPDPDKLSSYECGFEPFGSSRQKFDIRYYLVAILFVIFDIEIIFLFPWAYSLKQIGWFGFLSMVLFLLVLTLGFLYELKKGALEWD